MNTPGNKDALSLAPSNVVVALVVELEGASAADAPEPLWTESPS